MDITPVVPAGRQIINGYGDLGFTIDGERRDGSVLVFPDRTLAWAVTDPEAITAETLAEAVASAPELLLLGTGRTLVPVPMPLRLALKAAGTVVEAMDTGAACRTYNVLLAEDRRVAAALIAV